MKPQCVENVTPYQTGERKTEQIRKTFNTIAPRYDRLNRILSLGIDLSWRKKALHWLASSPPQHLLDVATGETICGLDAVEYSKNFTAEKLKEKIPSRSVCLVKRADCALGVALKEFETMLCSYGK